MSIDIDFILDLEQSVHLEDLGGNDSGEEIFCLERKNVMLHLEDITWEIFPVVYFRFCNTVLKKEELKHISGTNLIRDGLVEGFHLQEITNK